MILSILQMLVLGPFYWEWIESEKTSSERDCRPRISVWISLFGMLLDLCSIYILFFYTK